MGQLIAKKYPTKLFLKAADHTYVECGSGAIGWKCWGGKTGGIAFVTGSGSTNQANAIAEPNEKAGISCYLINGVCHQAANRILFPAQKLVIGARGYALSQAIFGPYGKAGVGSCGGKFNQHTGVTGDLPACIGTKGTKPSGSGAHGQVPLSTKDKAFLAAARQEYAKFSESKFTKSKAIAFNTKLFELQVLSRLGESIGQTLGYLVSEKKKFEQAHYGIVESLRSGYMEPGDYITAFNQMTLHFQDEVAGMAAGRYKDLMDLDVDERIILADPAIVASIYGDVVARQVYPEISLD